MKKLFREYFYIPENGKVREKVMLARITVSIFLILACMAAMSITAYAFFSHSVFSGQMTIKTKNYNLTVTPPEGMAVQENDVYTLYNDTDEEQEYVFSVTKEQEPNQVAVGYCKISVKTDINSVDITEDVQNFYTKPIGTFMENETETTVNIRRVKVTVAPHKTAIIRFIAEWGSCAKTPIIDEAVVPIYGDSQSGEQEGSGDNTETQQQSEIEQIEQTENQASEEENSSDTETSDEVIQNSDEVTENNTDLTK